jgi:hypothetical protein
MVQPPLKGQEITVLQEIGRLVVKDKRNEIPRRDLSWNKIL